MSRRRENKFQLQLPGLQPEGAVASPPENQDPPVFRNVPPEWLNSDGSGENPSFAAIGVERAGGNKRLQTALPYRGRERAWISRITPSSKFATITNGKTKAVKVAAKTKRQLQEIFLRGHARLFIYRLFACLIFFLVEKEIKRISHVTIDLEYPGKEKAIKDILLEFLRGKNLPEPLIIFKRIGRRPKVHYAAYDVFSGKKQENRKISLKDALTLVTKSDRGR